MAIYIGQQFRSFIKAKELMDYPTEDYNGSSLSLMADVGNTEKLKQSKVGNRWVGRHGYGMDAGETSLYDDIAANNVKQPISIDYTHRFAKTDRPLIVNGHHRIAAAAAINPEMLIPVKENNTLYGPHVWETADYGTSAGSK